MKYSFVKEIREMNLQFYDLKDLLLVLSNMGEKDFKRVYERLKNPNNRDVFVSLVLKLILNKYGSLDDVFKIMNKLEQLSFNDNALKLVNEDYIYVYRSLDELLELMDKASEKEAQDILFSIFYDLHILQYRNHSEHMKLIEKAKLYGYNYLICMTVVDGNILKNRSLKEHLQIMTMINNFNNTIISLLHNKCLLENRTFEELKNYVLVLKKYKYSSTVLNLLTNVDLIVNINANEHIALIDKLSEYDFDSRAKKVLLSEAMLANRTCEESFKLLEQVALNDYNEYIMKFVTDINVLKNRSNEEVLKLIAVLVELDSMNAYRIAISEMVLKYRSVDEQIILMKKICNTFRPNIGLFISYDYVALCNISQQLMTINLNSASKDTLSFEDALCIADNERELDELLGILSEYGDTKEMKLPEEYFVRKLGYRDLPF